MKQRFKKPGFWMLVGGNVVSIVACFLPLVRVLFVSVPFIEIGGKYVLALNIIALIWALFEPKYALILNIMSAFLVCFIYVNYFKDIFAIFSTGAGAYLVLIGNVVAVIGGIKDKRQPVLTDSKKDDVYEGENKDESNV